MRYRFTVTVGKGETGPVRRDDRVDSHLIPAYLQSQENSCSSW